MNFFTNCKTGEEAKDRYRELCKEHHPDKGGNTETMAEINKQYDAFSPPGFANFSSDPFERMSQHFNRGYQGFSQTYTFNRANYGDAWKKEEKIDPNSRYEKKHQDIPFDHPIHQRIRNLESDIATLKNLKSESDKRAAHWRSEFERKNMLNEHKHKEILDLKQKLTEAQTQVEELKKKPLTWWQKLFGVKHAK